MIITKVQCTYGITGSCDGNRVNCPHYHSHTESKDCEPSVCSRLSSVDRMAHCEVQERIFVRRKRKKDAGKKQGKRKAKTTNRDGGKDGVGKVKRIRLLRKKS